MNMNLTIKIERPLGIQHLGNPLGQNYTDYHMFFFKQYEKMKTKYALWNSLQRG